MQYILMVLAAAGIVALDQYTKYLVVANIGLHQQVPAIPGLFNFTYVQNIETIFIQRNASIFSISFFFNSMFECAYSCSVSATCA